MTTNETRAAGGTGLYGLPPQELIDLPAGARQVSPLLPGAERLEDLADTSLDAAIALVPPGTIERRHVLAHLLRALRPGGSLTALGPKDKGGNRIAAELEAFGCEAASDSRRHFRILETVRPAELSGIAAAIAAGAPRRDAALGLWTQAGIFAADRIDPGTRLLIDHLPPLAGRGADLGCGLGLLGRAALAQPKVTSLLSIDIDRRAVEAAERNLEDPRAAFLWADLRQEIPGLAPFDFVLSNPPFHDAGTEDRHLGQGFVRRAAALLRKGGSAVIVANRHLPYEAVLAESFARVALLAEGGGYKLFEARR